MKYTLLVAVALIASQSQAMDLTGVEVKEIPIRISAAKQRERALILKTPDITAGDLVQMTRDERIEVLQQLAIIEFIQTEYLKKEAEEERARDERIDPQTLCSAKFGPEYEYSGRVERLLPDRTKAASYLCVKFGPSQRTPYEKRMIQLKGYLAFVKFKLRHPLTAWPG
jgi:hypothetical protein